MINKNSECYYEIKKSKFISYKFEINSLKEFETFLNELKILHPKCSHICYAYKVLDQGQKAKAFDDKEPKGTAGYPILKLIETNNLNNVAIFVVRYFGGTKLGSGPLLRSYVKAASLAINKND